MVCLSGATAQRSWLFTQTPAEDLAALKELSAEYRQMLDAMSAEYFRENVNTIKKDINGLELIKKLTNVENDNVPASYYLAYYDAKPK